ncbi:MAG: sulfatase-like hydrolase/transferase, partial [Ferruginibacter sp.]
TYPVMVTLLLVLTVAWILILKFKKSLHGRLSAYINILLFIYCLLDGFILIKMQLAKPAEPLVDAVKFHAAAVTQKPDVYFLVFDGYPGPASLKDSFNFTNDSLKQHLTANAFKELPVFANYDLTYFCMASMFNMQYVKKDFEDLRITQRDFQKRGVEINRAAIFPIFKTMGYQVNNFSIFEIDDLPPVSDKNSFLPAHSILLTDKIFHKRLIRDVGDRLGRIIPFWKNSDFFEHDIDNKRSEELLIRDASEKKQSPRFVYAHFMMPHGPYYYDSLGNKNPFEKISDHNLWQDKTLFVSYIKYVNRRMMNMVDSIVKHSPQAIIVVMGDHGFRSFNSKQMDQPLRFDNLCMARFPNGNYAAMKNKWSNVNLFRYLFNSQFGQNMPYLADSSFTLRY